MSGTENTAAKLLAQRREQALYAKALVPLLKNVVIRDLTLLIIEEFPTSDPPPRSPRTRIAVATERAVKKFQSEKKIAPLKPIVDAAILQASKALQRAAVQIRNPGR